MQCFSLLSLCNEDDEEGHGIFSRLTEEHLHHPCKSLPRHAERTLPRTQVGRVIIDWRHKSLESMSLTGTQSLFHHNWEGKKQSNKWKNDYERDWKITNINHKYSKKKKGNVNSNRERVDSTAVWERMMEASWKGGGVPTLPPSPVSVWRVG